MRLLVVDDSPTIRKVVELTFRGSGWTLDFAASGREGIAAASSVLPDAVLLDFVLPDMRGLDVCARLSEHARTRAVPILIMSAKDESVRRLFAPYPSVVDFVKKPFTGEELLARVRTATADDEGRPRPSRAPSRFSLVQREQAAKAMYGRLGRAFAFIPSWCAQMGASAAAPFFARKILTPEVMTELLDALVPIYREILGVEKREATDDARALAGALHDWSVADLLTLLGASGRTGELRLDREGARTDVYFRAGEIVLVTSHDANHYLGDEASAFDEVDADARARAADEQRSTGKPLPITLADHDLLPPGYELAQAVHRASRRLLLAALDAGPVTFAWRDLAALPAYVAAHARYVPIARSTLMFGVSGQGPDAEHAPTPTPVPSLHDIALDRGRALSREAEASWPSAEMVLDRARGFSDRVKGLRLDATERRVLAVVTGRATLREAAARADLPEHEVRRIAYYLVEADLLTSASGARPVLIVEPDVDGFRRPLESLLARRADPVQLVSLDGPEALVAAALRDRPSLMIVNAGAAPDVRETARALRSHEALAGVPLVAVLELPAAGRAPELAAAGFDAVLVKPVAYADLERLIGL